MLHTSRHWQVVKEVTAEEGTVLQLRTKDLCRVHPGALFGITCWEDLSDRIRNLKLSDDLRERKVGHALARVWKAHIRNVLCSDDVDALQYLNGLWYGMKHVE